MEDENKPETGKQSRKKGCLVAALLVLALFLYMFRTMGEPDRRARRTHDAIQPGMSCWSVKNLLTGRHYCNFQVATDGKWEILSTNEFARFLATASNRAPDSARLQLHFMGTSPRRVSFLVYLDGHGAVTNLSKPYGWD